MKTIFEFADLKLLKLSRITRSLNHLSLKTIQNTLFGDGKTFSCEHGAIFAIHYFF